MNRGRNDGRRSTGTMPAVRNHEVPRGPRSVRSSVRTAGTLQSPLVPEVRHWLDPPSAHMDGASAILSGRVRPLPGPYVVERDFAGPSVSDCRRGSLRGRRDRSGEARDTARAGRVDISDLTGLILNCRVTRFILVRRALFACWRHASSASRTSATSRPQTPGRSQPAFSSSLESARIPLCRGCIRFFTWYSILWEFLFPCSVNPHGFASCRRRQKPKQPRTGSGRSEYGPEKWAHLLIPFFGRPCEV